MANFDIEGYLTGKGIHVRRASSQEVTIHCLWHNDPPGPGRNGKLSININPRDDGYGLWQCFSCGETGHINKIRDKLGDPPLGADDPASGTEVRAVLADALAYYENTTPREQLAQFFMDQRGLGLETLNHFRVTYAPGSDNKLMSHLIEDCKHRIDVIKASGLMVERDGKWRDFLSDDIVIPYIEKGRVMQLRARTPPHKLEKNPNQPKYRTPAGHKARLFNTDALIDSDEVVFVEGEFDAMVLHESGHKAVGIAGANNFTESMAGLFNPGQRVLIMFDSDAAGQSGAAKSADLLSKQPTVIIELPIPGIDPTDYYIQNSRNGAIFEELFEDQRFRDSILVSVRDTLAAWDTRAELDGIKFGMRAIDNYIKPGLLPGQVVTMLASTGAGKTQLVTSWLQSMAETQPDLKFMLFNLEQTAPEWFERQIRAWSVYHLDQTEDPTRIAQKAAEFWEPRMMLSEKNRIEADEFHGALDHYQAVHGRNPDVVFVDYLGYWSRSMPGNSEYDKVSAGIMMLKELAKERGLIIITPSQVGRSVEYGTRPKIDKARGSGVVEETSDFLFSMWRPDGNPDLAREQHNGMLHLALEKSRHGGAGNEMHLQTGPITITAIDPASRSDLAQRVKQELQMAPREEHWELAVYRHRTGNYSAPRIDPAHWASPQTLRRMAIERNRTD